MLSCNKNFFNIYLAGESCLEQVHMCIPTNTMPTHRNRPEQKLFLL